MGGHDLLNKINKYNKCLNKTGFDFLSKSFCLDFFSYKYWKNVPSGVLRSPGRDIVFPIFITKEKLKQENENGNQNKKYLVLSTY